MIARHQLIGGTPVPEEHLTVRGLIPPGHKVAARDIEAGELVRRYSQTIGIASRAIKAGEHVHLHNLAMVEYERDHAFCTDLRETTRDSSESATFLGIERADGRIATRNFIGILTSVNCSATVAHAIADHFRRDVHAEALADYPNVDGVIALTHGGGCGIDPVGEGAVVLRRTLAGYARHPNFAAVLLVGLGCESNQIGDLTREHALSDVRTYTIQDSGGTRKSIARGIELVKEILPAANRVSRRRVSAAHLVVGLQCGGSDGYSGITANPALGKAVDLLVQNGGTAILSETPEIYGAEHLLTRRAVTPEVGSKLLRRFQWWKDYCSRNGASLTNNPSAGNKAGGLTTLLEKALGGVAKGGTTNLVE
ncbi:MAG TPA: altronate dehydratase family protein, partial [Steroidobacteraceae bacterium]